MIMRQSLKRASYRSRKSMKSNLVVINFPVHKLDQINREFVSTGVIVIVDIA